MKYLFLIVVLVVCAFFEVNYAQKYVQEQEVTTLLRSAARNRNNADLSIGLNTMAFHKANEYGLDSLAARALSYIGDLYLKKSFADSSLYFLNYTLSYAQNSGDTITIEVANVYNNLGHLFRRFGDSNQAREYYMTALEVRKKLKVSGTVCWGSYNNIGNCYFDEGEYDNAMIFYKAGLGFLNDSKGDYRSKTNGLSNVARTFLKLGEIDSARFYLDQVPLKENNPTYHQQKTMLEYLSGRYDSALFSMEKTISIREKYLHHHNELMAQTYLENSKILDSMGRSKQAYELLVKTLNYQSLTPTTMEFAEREYYSERTTIDALFLMSKQLYKNYLKTRSVDDRNKVLLLTDRALDYYVLFRNQFLNSQSSFENLKSLNYFFEFALDMSYKIYSRTKDSLALEIAFKSFEIHKSKRLLAGAKNDKELLTLYIPESGADSLISLQREYYLNLRSSKLDVSVTSTDSLVPKDFSLEVRRYLVKYLSLKADLEQRYPQLKNVTFSDSVPSINAVISLFASETSVTSFRVVAGKLYSLSFKGKQMHFKRERVHKLESEISELVRAVKKFDPNKFTMHQQYCSNKLLPHLIAAKQIVVVPDEYLWSIPFEVLKGRKNSKKFLIEESIVSYHHSLLGYLFERNNALPNYSYKREFVGLAPFTKKVGEVNPLKSSVEEIGLFALTRGEFVGTELIDEDATTKNIIMNIQSTEMAHFATHSIGGSVGSEPFMLLRSEQGGVDTLTLRDLILSRSNVRTAILSSCESGIGTIERGEGVISLARGFLVNRSENVLYTLWKVFDSPTLDFMTKFYRNFNGENFDESLAITKREMIKNKATSFPALWAPFVGISN